MQNAANAIDSTSAELSVLQRYSAASRRTEPALCCPTGYAGDLLAVIPQEVVERDYGCGDPTPYVRAGETVLDLGSGAGKLCFMLSQVVGPQGKVIGVDCNEDMLQVARSHRDTVADRLGYANVEFRCGMIQDLKLDLDALGETLAERPVDSADAWIAARTVEERLRRERPLVPDESIDCVVSNCVLNLVRPEDRRQLFPELFRVLKPGGRAAISDIVCDEDVPEHLQRDGRLWSGCLSGAFREDRFLQAFAEAGFHGMQIANRQHEPWRTVEGIEFRSVTVLAWKGTPGPGLERNQALVYKGPFRSVEDDEGRVYVRGERTAVGDGTFHRLQTEPFAGLFEPIEPRDEVPPEAARPFDPRRARVRDPRETKGCGDHLATQAPGPCCGEDATCC